MKMLKTIPVFILLFIGYLCNAEDGVTALGISPATGRAETFFSNASTALPGSRAMEAPGSDHVPGRSLPTLVVAGVSIALVLLCTLIVAISWYAWRKSQEGSMVLNPIPCGEAGASSRNPWMPENQQEWPFERAVP